jgi:hypothetical protein
VSYATRSVFEKEKMRLGCNFLNSCLVVITILAAEGLRFYKINPLVRTQPVIKGMPQLDFREALSTPEEKLRSRAGIAPSSMPSVPI